MCVGVVEFVVWVVCICLCEFYGDVVGDLFGVVV